MDAKQATSIELEKITNLSNDAELEALRLIVLDSFDHFETKFDKLKEKVKAQIRKEESSYLQDSYKEYDIIREHKYIFFNMEISQSQPNYLEQLEHREKNLKFYIDRTLNRRLDVSESGLDTILHRILRHSSWQNTTMIIHPGTESWINHLVSNDPLYIVDESHDLLKPVMSQFNESYQQRLRPYVITENDDCDMLWQLPDNQFGLVLTWNYFNHRPFEVIRQYLTEIYTKLRPGGMLMMTFNDCDRWEGVKAVESKSALYTPGFLIRGFAEHLGFEEKFVWHENGPWTWIEFRKPGEWQSLRGGQSLAKILPKPVA
jgi:SAM-dependent methyltransferase